MLIFLIFYLIKGDVVAKYSTIIRSAHVNKLFQPESPKILTTNKAKAVSKSLKENVEKCKM